MAAKKKTEVVELRKGSRELAEMVYKFRFVLSFENKEEPDFSIENAAKEIHEYFEKKYRVLGLFEENDLIGFAVVRKEKRKKIFWLENIYVLPDYRGYDNASMLFDYAQEMAKNAGADGLNVPVPPDNEAMIKFLRKKGYVSE
jgi:GNAT superfamily N-acetyltransferase